MILAETIAKKILITKPDNQEARLVSMVKAYNSKNEIAFPMQHINIKG